MTGWLKLAGFPELCRGKNILVVGDVMLDKYFFGDVNRISPEAPVPVVDVRSEDSRPGGAANVALNIVSLGGKAFICGVTGADDDGTSLRRLLGKSGIDAALLFEDKDRRTTSKIRIIATSQHTLRIDREDRNTISDELSRRIFAAIERSDQKFDAIVLEEYDKGMLRSDFVRRVIEFARNKNIPVAADPKLDLFFDYSGCTLFKPNLRELNFAMHATCPGNDLAGIAALAMALRKKMPHTLTMITTGEHGMLVIDENGDSISIPAHLRKIRDVSGAGDTVISVAVLALAGGLKIREAAMVANLAGGLVCEEVGVVPVGSEKLAEEIGRMV